MARHFAQFAIFCILGLAGLSGCSSSARLVTTTPNGGIVAIPNNSNSWPDYHRQHAEEVIRAQCPNGYVIEREEEYITGTTQYTDTTTNTTGDSLLAALHIAPITEKSRQTTSFQDHTEWRIYYRKKEAPPGSAPQSLVQPAGGMQPVIVPSIGLTPPEPLPLTPSPVLTIPGVPSSKALVPAG